MEYLSSQGVLIGFIALQRGIPASSFLISQELQLLLGHGSSVPTQDTWKYRLCSAEKQEESETGGFGAVNCDHMTLGCDSIFASS